MFVSAHPYAKLLLLFFFFSHFGYFIIFVTTPAPTVLPPSRMANLCFFFKSYGSDQFDGKLYRIARHNHFHALGQSHISGNISSSDVELRFVAVEKRGCAGRLLLFGQNINFGLKFRMRRNRARLGQKPGRGLNLLSSSPLKRMPALSPAMPSSSCLLNISMPVNNRFFSFSQADYFPPLRSL